MNILLQILDDGRITDAQGRTVNFENTVIVMTTNAGSDKRTGSVGFNMSADEQGKEKAVKALNDFLRPEFINRVDEIIYFHRLTEENIRAIASLMLEDLRTAMAERGTALTWDESVITYLAEKGYSAAYGARNLQRLIQKDVEDAIATEIIDHLKGAAKPSGSPYRTERSSFSRFKYDKCLARGISPREAFLLCMGFQSARQCAPRLFLRSSAARVTLSAVRSILRSSFHSARDAGRRSRRAALILSISPRACSIPSFRAG